MTEAEERRIKSEFREACIDAVAEKAKVEVPDKLATGRASEMWERTVRALAGQGISREAYLQIADKSEEEMLEEAKPDAEQSLRREAVIAALVAKEGIKPGDDELHQALEHSAEHEGITPAELLEKLREDLRDRRLIRELSARKAVDLVEERAKPVPAKPS
jgi:trigger factor